MQTHSLKGCPGHAGHLLQGHIKPCLHSEDEYIQARCCHCLELVLFLTDVNLHCIRLNAQAVLPDPYCDHTVATQAMEFCKVQLKPRSDLKKQWQGSESYQGNCNSVWKPPGCADHRSYHGKQYKQEGVL